MARRQKLTARVYIKNEKGEDVLWYEYDEDGNLTMYLSEEETNRHRQKILDNIGKRLSLYAQANPDCSFLR